MNVHANSGLPSNLRFAVLVLCILSTGIHLSHILASRARRWDDMSLFYPLLS